MKRLLYLFFFLLVISAACSKSIETSLDVTSSPVPAVTQKPFPSSSPVTTPSPKPTESLDGKAPSLLTGEYIDEDCAAQRPIAVVINNLDRALPQSGINQAGLYYEVLSEGEITRIIAVFQGAMSEKIGPIRSARDYFIRFALENGAIFAHHGGSDKAYANIKSMKISNIDGMRYDGTLYWRDPVRSKMKGMYEHSSYSSSANLLEAARNLGYELSAGEDAKPLFSYYEKDTRLKGEPAVTVNVPFSKGYGARFEYDKESKLYLRFQSGGPTIDEEDGKQLAVKNILIQSVKMNVIAGDSYGRRDVKLTGEGVGWLVSGGEYKPVKWSRADDYSQTKWFDENGEELLLNKGKTFICVLQSDRTPLFE